MKLPDPTIQMNVGTNVSLEEVVVHLLERRNSQTNVILISGF